MKVNRLAGARRYAPQPIEPPAEPQFRWTLKTWVVKEWTYSDTKSKPVVEGTKRTMTVVASNENDAKRRIEAALPPLPLSETSDYGVVTATFERRWSLEAEVVEVER